MKRRDFVAASAIFSLLASAPAFAAKKNAAKKSTHKPSKKPARSAAHPPRDPFPSVVLPEEPPAQWRNYELTSALSLKPGKARIWLPLPQYKDSAWQRALGHNWQGNFSNASIYRDPVSEMEVFYAEWNDNVAAPQLKITSQVATQDRHFDITRRGAGVERTEVLRQCMQATSLMPIDGAVFQTAEKIVGRLKDPVVQGKAIYDWVVDNATYDAKQAGYGKGDVAAMLESGQFRGKSADLSLLFVSLCRSIGLPARPVLGTRIDNSRLFSCLGSSGELNSALHCRAEFYAPGYGWIPVDPADVRKAISDESLSNTDSKRAMLKKLLFGFWEMNWIALNTAQDVKLRGSTGASLPFLLTPQVENAAGRFDLKAEALSYSLTAKRGEG